MIPVDQQTENDCLRACVASLLSVPLDGVADLGDGEDQKDRLTDWLAKRGLYPVYLDAESFGDWRPGGFHIMCGAAAGGHPRHAVVGYRGEMVHDPHPDRLGLSSVDTHILLVIEDLRLVKPSGGAA